MSVSIISVSICVTLPIYLYHYIKFPREIPELRTNISRKTEPIMRTMLNSLLMKEIRIVKTFSIKLEFLLSLVVVQTIHPCT